MTEEKKKVAARRSTRKKTEKSVDKDVVIERKNGFNTKDGLGNELIGIFISALGLLIFLGSFTSSTGKIGAFLKNLNFDLFGFVGYLFPIFLMILGVLIIVRKYHILLTKRAAGVLLIAMSIFIFMSESLMYLSKDKTLGEAIGKITELEHNLHGGILGFLISLPVYKLTGDVGAFIISLILLLTGIILILNTSFYDSMKKTRDISLEARDKIREKRNLRDFNSYEEDSIQSVNTSKRKNNTQQLTIDDIPKENFDDIVDRDLEDRTQGIYRENVETSKTEKKSFLDILRGGKNKDDEGNKQKPINNKSLKNDVRDGKANEKERLEIPYFLCGQERKEYKEAVDKQHVSNSSDKFNIELKDPNANRFGGVFYAEDIPLARSKPVNNDFKELNPYDTKDSLKDLARNNSKNHRDQVNNPESNLESNLETIHEDDDSLKDIPPVEVEKSEAEIVETELTPTAEKKTPYSEVPKTKEMKTEGSDEDKNKKIRKYNYPEIGLLKENIKGMLANEDRRDIMENAKKLQETLMSFGVEAKVIHVSKGPSVTRYELQPRAGIKVSKIVNLADDIALSLAANGVRIEAPIPGKAAVGIEIPNKEQSPVFLREVIQSEKFQKSTNKIAIALGKDITGESIIGDMAKFPHVLIAGATGSGKSVCINSLIVSILYKYTPEEVRLLMVDPKVVELNVYNGIPHLLIPVVTDPKKAAGALNWAVNEMTRRYQLFADNGARNIESFNELYEKGKVKEKLPYIVVIVDELADLMMVSANEIEDYIARLAQMARAAGMHLVIATQRPSVDVITGVIKANIPSRISFAVSSSIDSRTILDQSGAEKLLGKGDMLFYPSGVSKPKRVQGAFISEDEVEAIVNHVKVIEEDVQYDNSILEHIEKGSRDSSSNDETDELFDEACRIVVETGQASTSYLQRRMRIGYNRAARIMDELEDRGVISGPDGSKPRKVIWTASDI